tara:strand:+ start:1345 stop:3351 length:2007 start_codon:yes stop_codon:yes gene_type:complete
MAFLVSPGVQVNEVDLTNVVPAVATSIGAIAGAFEKGPVGSIQTVTSEGDLVSKFGKPNSNNFENWLAAASFLQYGNTLRMVRAESAIVNAGANSGILIRDDDHYEQSFRAGQGSHGEWAARSAGTWGNSIGVAICATATAYEQVLSASNLTVGEDAVGATTIAVDDADLANNVINVGDMISFFSDSAGTTPVTGETGNEYEVTAISTNDLTIRLKDDPNGAGVQNIIPDNSYIKRKWRFHDLFDRAPGTSPYATENGKGTADEMHIVVYDTTGNITGFDVDVAGQRTKGVLETYAQVSKHPSAKTPQGNSNYYPDVIFSQSTNVYWTDHTSSGSNWGTDISTGTAFTAVDSPVVDSLTGGTDDYSLTNGEISIAYNKFADAESVDVNLIIGGSSSIAADTQANYDTHGTMLIDLASARLDCMAFISPHRAATVGVADPATQTTNVKNAAATLPSSSYAVLDSGYKYMYDRYNDVYRYIPLSGDIAGLCARTDDIADVFFSPAGFNRGTIRGAVKLSYNPNQSQRDDLYAARVNPVVNFPGQGVTLFGDKTALTTPSAFDRINVRRLFIVLEKAISTASKFQLFEFNDAFTRAQFKNLVEPFLRDIQGRRGIDSFQVVCDGTNNTGEVVDRNEFVADVYVKPARSINFITLNFIATRTGVAFSEVGGA